MTNWTVARASDETFSVTVIVRGAARRMCRMGEGVRTERGGIKAGTGTRGNLEWLQARLHLSLHSALPYTLSVVQENTGGAAQMKTNSI